MLDDVTPDPTAHHLLPHQRTELENRMASLPPGTLVTTTLEFGCDECDEDQSQDLPRRDRLTIA